jgi:peptide/nickel transport system substrate-binding protein
MTHDPRHKRARLARHLPVLIAVLLVATACGSSGDSEETTTTTTETATTSAGATTTTQGGTDTTTSAAPAGGTLIVAMDAEPATLDPHATTQSTTHKMAWHMFEGLFTVDANFDSAPMLVEDYSYDESSMIYTFELRPGVTFHDGTTLDAEDVVTSMERWLVLSFNGRQLAGAVAEVRSAGELTVELEMNGPFAPTIPLLTFPNQGLAIMPSEIMQATGEGELTEFVGTGPFELAARVPDVEVRFTRFDGYASRSDAASGMAGARSALVDELVFRPVPEVSVRRDMVITGEVHVTESINPEMLSNIESADGVEAYVVKPLMSPLTNFNKQWGPTADIKVRQAIAAALDMGPIMEAAFGDESFYRLDPSTIFQEVPWWSDGGAEFYNQADPDRARELLAESSYNGEPLLWLTTRDRPWQAVIATVVEQQLEAVGLNVELEVVDTPTIAARRAEREGWSAYDTANSFIPDPATWVILDSTVIGWWEDERKDQLVAEMNAELDHEARLAIWDELEYEIWNQVPVIKYGDFYGLGARSSDVVGAQDFFFDFYWNVALEDR